MKYLFTVFLFTLSSFSFCQDITSKDTMAGVEPKNIAHQVIIVSDSIKGISQFLQGPAYEASPIQWGLSIAVLCFGLILSLSVMFMMFKSGKGFGNMTFKILGIILILTASLFLITAGYDSNQITPVIGLLGTMAGFIFGSNINNNPKTPTPTTD